MVQVFINSIALELNEVNPHTLKHCAQPLTLPVVKIFKNCQEQKKRLKSCKKNFSSICARKKRFDTSVKKGSYPFYKEQKNSSNGF